MAAGEGSTATLAESNLCDGCGAVGLGGRFGEKEYVGKWYCTTCWDAFEHTSPRMSQPPALERRTCMRCGEQVALGGNTGHERFCADCWGRWNCAEGKTWAHSSDLDALLCQYGSDKSSDVHGYAKVYEGIFGHCREETCMLLEVGIGTVNPNGSSSMSYLLRDGVAPHYRPGGSARAWRDYFPNCTVVSIDVDADTMVSDEERIITHLCDSTQESTRDMLIALYGPSPFDIIIDDGDHNPDSQQATLKNLWQMVRPGGLYIVEDVHWRQGERHPFVHGDDLDPSVLHAFSEGAPFLAIASPGQGKWAATSHNSNLLVLRRPSKRSPHRSARVGWEPIS